MKCGIDNDAITVLNGTQNLHSIGVKTGQNKFVSFWRNGVA